MHRLRPLVLLLFAAGVLFAAAEPECALAHTKVHPGALALVETARVADAPTAPSPVLVSVALLVVALVVLGRHLRPFDLLVGSTGDDDDRPPAGLLARRAFARRGPPAPAL